MVFKRTIIALKKLAFCRRISADLSTFIKLVTNAKRFAWSDIHDQHNIEDFGERYVFQLEGQHRNVFLRTYTGDIQIFFDIFWKKNYKLPPAFLTRFATIIDLGAHTGLSTLYFRLSAPHSRVYSVEPDGENFKLLQKNLEQEIEAGNVIPINAAITEKEQTTYIQKSKLSFNTSVSISPTVWSVAGITIHEILERWNLDQIDLLKVDIEGGEAQLFGVNTLWLGRVRNIIIEIHSSENLLTFQNIMDAYNFKIKKLPVEHEEVYWAYR